MMKFIVCLAVFWAIIAPLEGASTRAKAGTSKAKQVSPAHSKSSKVTHISSKSKKSSKSARASKGKRGKGKKHVASRRSGQLQPAPERLKEIQQVLADKGYYKGEVNGQWDADSVEALKRFQNAQNIKDDGKINSLSLIGLGLGPNHANSISPVAPPAPNSSATAAPSTTPQNPSPDDPQLIQQ